MVLCTLEYAQAQATYICDEHFSSKAPQGWSIQPAFSATTPSWKTDTDVVVSAKYAMHGHIPFTTGDTIELVTPFFDCSNYAYVLLRFKHICKVLSSDICEIQYQEQGLGTNYKWKAIPWDAYKGGCALYRTDLNFSHAYIHFLSNLWNRHSVSIHFYDFWSNIAHVFFCYSLYYFFCFFFRYRSINFIGRENIS